MNASRGAHVCARARVCECVLSEIKYSYQSLRYVINDAYFIYTSNHLNLCHVDYQFVLICADDVEPRGASDSCVE